MSAHEVTDPGAVGRAIAECEQLGRDAFLSRYGFARSTRYVLRHDGHDYDPPAILAVAHREQHGRVLAPKETRGAPAVLAGLGFEIVDLTPPWREDEMVLALDVYLRHRGERLGKTHPDVRDLSDTLRRLGPLQGDTRRSVFRNPAGVEQQLGKFLDLDPRSTIRGRGQPSALHRAIWERYGSKPRPLRRRVAEIMNSLEGLPPLPPPRPSSAAKEGKGTAKTKGRESAAKVAGERLLGGFVARPELVGRKGKPRWVDPEAYDRANGAHELTRLALAKHLEANGFSIHEGTENDLRFDVGGKRGSVHVIAEVKSLPPRDEEVQLRLGLGQILWYRDRWRERTDDPCVAVLCVEREPARREPWLALCDSVAVVLTWPERFDALVAECMRLSQVRRATYRR